MDNTMTKCRGCNEEIKSQYLMPSGLCYRCDKKEKGTPNDLKKPVLSANDSSHKKPNNLLRNLSLVANIILVVIIFNLYSNNFALKSSIFYKYEAIPHIELINYLRYSFAENIFSGQIRGFVKFDNIIDQPKDARQYYIIEATNRFDKNRDQIFTLEEIVALNYIPPSSIGKTDLSVKTETDDSITLADEDENEYIIDKIDGSVAMEDVTGDRTTLITNQSDYKKFMEDFLKPYSMYK